MALSDVVNVTISRSSPGVTAAGFGIPLIGTPRPSWVELTRTYATIAAVAADFATSTPEYAAANQMFSQDPAPERIMFGRMGHKPTKVQIISFPGAGSIIDSTLYAVRIWCAGVLQTATFTSGVSTTGALIMAGITAAINALAVPDIGATAVDSGAGASAICTVTGDAAGNYFEIEILDLNLLAAAETTADPSGTGTVDDLTAIAAESSAWYGLCLIFKSKDIVLAAAGWVESNTKLFIMSSSDSQCATHALSGATDVLAALKSASRARTGPAYHPRGYEFFDASELGRWFPIDPGKDNWRMKTLSGVTPGTGVALKALTGTWTTNIEAKRGNYYIDMGGVNVVFGDGLVSDNEYIDVIRGIDWWTARLQERIVNLEISLEKIPFTDDGVTLIKNQVRAQNSEGISAGLINPNPAPTVTAPKVADVSPADKAARHLPDVNTAWTLAGAINDMDVNATVTQ